MLLLRTGLLGLGLLKWNRRASLTGVELPASCSRSILGALLRLFHVTAKAAQRGAREIARLQAALPSRSARPPDPTSEPAYCCAVPHAFQQLVPVQANRGG